MVDIIRELCHKQNTNVSSLEKKLGFSNGSISKWDTTSPSHYRIKMVADELGVDVDYLLGKTDTPAPASAKEVTDSDLMYALFDGPVTNDDLEDVKEYAKMIRERRRRKREQENDNK